MSLSNALLLYNAALGVLAGLGLLYLLYLQRFVVQNRRFILVTTVGILTFTTLAPLFQLVAPAYLHLVHGVAALLVILGLYDPVHNDLRKDEWASLLLKNPTDLRHPAEWMVPMDDEILTLFHTSDLVLTPAIIAYNIDRSREEVNRRLSELEDCGLVDRIERGKYRITDVGIRYLGGSTEWSRSPTSRDRPTPGTLPARNSPPTATAAKGANSRLPRPVASR